MATVRYGDFEWNDKKAAANLRKHGVSFVEATEVFKDPLAVDAPDRYAANRFVIIGRSSRDRLLFVVHAVLEGHGRVRIISARKASPAQRKAFRAD